MADDAIRRDWRPDLKGPPREPAPPARALRQTVCREPGPPAGSSEAVSVDGEEIPSIVLERLTESERATLQSLDSLEAAYGALDWDALIDEIKKQMANPSQYILTHDQLRDLTDTEREELHAMYTELDSMLGALDAREEAQ